MSALSDKRVLQFPTSPSVETLDKEQGLPFDPKRFDSPDFDHNELVTLHGYINVAAPGKFVHLHQRPVLFEYFRIPYDAIYSIVPHVPDNPKGIYDLRVHKDTPIQFHQIKATVEMTATGLMKSVGHKGKASPIKDTPDSPSPCGGACSRACCILIDNVWICNCSSVTDDAIAALFGFQVSLHE